MNWLLVKNEKNWIEHIQKCRSDTPCKQTQEGATPEKFPCLVYSYFDIVIKQWVHMFVYEDDALSLLKPMLRKLASTLHAYRNPKNWRGKKWIGQSPNPMNLAQQAISETNINHLTI